MNFNLLKTQELVISSGQIIVPKIMSSLYLFNLKDSTEYNETPDNSKLETLIQSFNEDSGKCIGKLDLLKVSESTSEGLTSMSNILQDAFTLIVWSYTGAFNSPVQDNIIATSNIASSKLQHIFNINSDITFDVSEIGSNIYSNVYNWKEKYGVSHLNGTNDFPYMGWSGALLGSSIANSTFETDKKFYVWPFTYLPLGTLIPQGVIMAGQGVQYNGGAKMIPYQQGIGTYDFINREPVYLDNLIDRLDIISTFPPEGAVAGRNNFFVGIAITDYASSNLNIENHQKGSLTFQDIRTETRIAHPAPLTINVSEVDRALPWTNVWNYNTDEDIPILREGITNSSICGAYPLYRGSWNSTFSGRVCRTSVGSNGRWWSEGLSQYYTTEEYWNPNEQADSISIDISSLSNPADPDNPFKIKGGKIILYEGQRVIKNSYVYSTANMVGNVNIVKYFPDSAKEIFLDNGRVLPSDPYSKYQSNQGSLIVIVVQDGEDPPIPISNAQPVGIVLEEVVGEGTYEKKDAECDDALRVYQNNASSDLQTGPLEGAKTLSNRDINIYLFPMYAQLWSSGIPSCFGIQGVPYGTTVGTKMIADDEDNWEEPPICSPKYDRIRNNYMISDSPYCYSYALEETVDNSKSLNLFGTNRAQQYTLASREGAQDWPGPQMGIQR